MELPRFKKILLIIIPLAMILSLWQLWLKKPQPAVMELIPEPTQAPTPASQSAESIDGQIQLKLEPQPIAEGIAWTLTSQTGTATAETIWRETLPAGTQVILPFNAVSPDNKYLFISQSGPTGNRHLLLSTVGSPAREFSEPFYAQFPELIITDVTGWGGINLIVLNTDNLTGTAGPSFWYEAPTRAFIRLTNRFN